MFLVTRAIRDRLRCFLWKLFHFNMKQYILLEVNKNFISALIWLYLSNIYTLIYSCFCTSNLSFVLLYLLTNFNHHLVAFWSNNSINWWCGSIVIPFMMMYGWCVMRNPIVGDKNFTRLHMIIDRKTNGLTRLIEYKCTYNELEVYFFFGREIRSVWEQMIYVVKIRELKIFLFS